MERPHLVAVVCDPSPLGHRDSQRLSLSVDQLAHCLLADPIWLHVPLAAAMTARNTKVNSSSDSE